MSKNNFLLKIKNQLLLEKENLLSQMISEIGVDIDGDETDEIQGNMIMNVASQIALLKKNKFNKIEEALAKINNHTYGTCEDCGEEISEKRLMINPHFTICVFCAEIKEKENNQRKRSTF
jgi:DnaK suppressor protein